MNNRNPPQPSSLAELWSTQEKIETLHRGLCSLMDVTGCKYKFIAEDVWKSWCEKTGLTQEHYATSATISRFCRKGSGLTKNIQRTSLLFAICSWGRGAVGDGFHENAHKSRSRDERSILALFDMATIAEQAGLKPAPQSDGQGGDNKLLQLKEMIGKILRTTPEEFEQPVQQFFSESDRLGNKLNSHFLAYRFGQHPGEVIKSFLVVKRPGGLSGMSEFCHFYDNRTGRKRDCRGVILPFHNVLGFLGSFDQGEAVELIVFRKQNSPQETYDGLIITFSDDMDPVCGRIVLSRTEHIDHRKAGAKIYDVKDFEADELALINRVRNRVRFTLERSINKQNRRLQQSEIVSTVAELLRLEGDELLKFDDGHPFNPASDSHYTFNSALGLPRSDGH